MYTPSQCQLSQVRETFAYHPPHGNQAERYTMLRAKAGELATQIIYQTPPSREQSLALTKLQEVVMFANASIAIHEQWDGADLVAPIVIKADRETVRKS